MLLNPLPVIAYPDQLLDAQLDEVGEVFGDFSAIRGAWTIFGADVSDAAAGLTTNGTVNAVADRAVITPLRNFMQSVTLLCVSGKIPNVIL
jgi:hypothetical protein